jgi:tagatose 1,6-diphosphate aldolase GatY/KbaY
MMEAHRYLDPPSRENYPLVLHGASGLPSEMIARAMDEGVCKFNVNTDLRHASMNAIRRLLSQAADHVDVLDLMKISTTAMFDEAVKKIRFFQRQIKQD